MEEIEKLDFEEEPKKKRKLKKKVKIFLILFIILIVLICTLASIYVFLLSPVSSKSEIVEFTIDNGMTVYGTGQKLKNEKIIRSSLAYKLIVKYKKISAYDAGTYKLNKGDNIFKIIDELSNNKYTSDDITITFKEGKTIRNVAKVIGANTNISEDIIYEKLSDSNYINGLISKYWFLTKDIKNEDIYYPLEGYLYPETYKFSKNVTIDVIFDTMLKQTDKVLSKYKSQIDSSSYSVHELITLASIVESEGIYQSDRNKIAGVFYNRLKAGMPLGSDITTYYAFKIDLSERDLTKAEINTYNPYNTRGPKMNGKLPVGPVSNVSESSINAVLNPEENDYYYFVADKSGKTHFSKTYEEHQKIISELKKANNWIEW